MITHFDSVGEYFSFVFAREFWDRQHRCMFAYPKGRLEQIGEWLTKPVMGFADYTFKNIKNPLFITALMIVGIAIATIAFYPVQFTAVVGFVFPPLLKITPGVLKFGTYLTIVSTILGLFFRAIHRLSPDGELMKAWETRDAGALSARRLVPIPIGMTFERRP